MPATAFSARWSRPGARPSGTRIAIDLGEGAAGATGPGEEGGPIFEPPPFGLDGRLFVLGSLCLTDRSSLRTALCAEGGEPSRDAEDIELLWWACRLWGEEAADRLTGDFAFLAWDASSGSLMAARDVFGIEPLYYVGDASGIALSNWPDLLLDASASASELDEEGVLDYLLFDSPIGVEGTAWRRLRRLPAGEVRVWRCENGVPEPKISRRHRWPEPLHASDIPKDGPELVDEFLRRLSSAVAEHRRPGPGGGEVPALAISMSGGLDSTALAALAAEQGPTIAHTSVYRRLLPDLEGPPAAAAAERLGIAHHVHVLDDFAFFEGWRDLPVGVIPGDPMVDQLYHDLDSKISATATRVLTGWGGDPLLLPERRWWRRGWRSDGWTRTVARGLSAWWTTGLRPPLGLDGARRRRLAEQRPIEAWQADLPFWLDPDLARRTRAAERLREHTLGKVRAGQLAEAAGLPPAGARPEAWRHSSSPGWAHHFERIHGSARWGRSSGPWLDRRHPFFDLRVVELALALPTLPWCQSKYLLRQAMTGRLPKRVVERPKSPQPGDPAHAFDSPPLELWREWTASAPALSAYVNVKAVHRWLRQRQGKALGQASPIRQAANLACWLHRLGNPPTRPSDRRRRPSQKEDQSKSSRRNI